MGINIYKNGYWVEPTFIRKYSNGAWIDCEFVKQYKNGYWVEVWSGKSTLRFYATILNDGATYTLTTTADNKTLNFSLNGAGDTSNTVILSVSNANGFGTNPTIKYTVKQTLTDMYAGTYWLDSDMKTKLISKYTSIASATTYTQTVTTNNATTLYFIIDAWKSYNISGEISNVFINGEPILFSI